jgi:hypothetical protein
MKKKHRPEHSKKSITVSISVQDTDPIQSGDEGAWETFSSTYIFNEDQETLERTSPERVMFIAVFLQSLLDATKPEYEGEPRSAIADRNCAVKWFTLPECVTASTFEPICELAGIDPDYARRYFKLIMKGEREFTYRRINILLNASKN